MKREKTLFKLLKKILKLFYKKRSVIGKENIPDDASLIIGNHAQLHGPITAELYFPAPASVWCIGEMMSMREAPNYAYKDFFAYKPKFLRPIFKAISYIIAPMFVYLCGNAKTIAVYKDARLISTIRKTIERLNSGEHVILFPECHSEYNEIINEFQDKFVDVAKFYYRKYGKELSFVPMYNAPHLQAMAFGKPIKYDSTLPVEEQREKICNYIKREITSIAKSLPYHTVVPYANIPKRKYPKSKNENLHIDKFDNK